MQWQLSVDGGATWNNIRTGKTAKLTVSRATGAVHGSQYRAVLTNAIGTFTTPEATLTVIGIPTVTLQPAVLTIATGTTATSTAALSEGNGTIAVQWEVKSPTSTTYAPISGATSTMLSFMTRWPIAAISTRLSSPMPAVR